jgi:hypothetical protein
VGNKRVEAPTTNSQLHQNLSMSHSVDEEEAGILAAELATGIPDSEVRLSYPDLLKRKSLFKKYTPFTLLKLISSK